MTSLADGESPASNADAAWHLRPWGRHVLAAARRELAARYPTYAEFEPVRRKGRRRVGTAGNVRFRRRPPRLLEPDEDGKSIHDAAQRGVRFALPGRRDQAAVDRQAGRRVSVGAHGPLRRLPGRDSTVENPLAVQDAKKRVRLTLEPRTDGSGVDFGIEQDVPEDGGNAAQKREHDRMLGAGTMSANGARCPTCGAIATTKDIRAEGLAGRLGERMTAVVVEGQAGKEYRLPTGGELDAARVERAEIEALYAGVPFGPPNESIVAGAAVSQLARGVRSAALRVRHVAHALHGPAAPGARHVRPGDPRLLYGNGRLPGRLARGDRRLAGAFDQSAGR